MRYWWLSGVVGARPEITERWEHLDSLNFSFQLVLHVDSASRSACNRMQSCGECIDLRHLVSSASRNELECFRDDESSFIYYMRNRRGPSRLPWGTPETTGRVIQLLLLMHTYWCLLDRYSWNHLHRLPTTQTFHSLSSSSWSGTLSKAFLKSR